MKDRYRRFGHAYDGLCRFGTAGAIDRCRIAAFEGIRPGDRVLFAGVGPGRDAIEAARRGAIVTAVELSPTMRAVFLENRPEALAPHVRLVAGDILDFDEPGAYDLVVANFFQNVFDAPAMRKILAHLVTQLRPGGLLIVGDVGPPQNPASRLLTGLYWWGASLLFRGLTGNALHRLHDYPVEMKRAGLVVGETRRTRMVGIPCLHAITARKP